MDRRGPEAEPQFSQPISQITWMLIVLGLVGAGAYLAYPTISPLFLANPGLNGFIVLVFFIGVLACFLQVFTLMSSVRWLERFAGSQTEEAGTAPRLLAPLATLLRARSARMQLGATSTRSILDSVATRIDEAREITRYLVNLLIFLGLLGTFYGLATTVPAVVDTIRSLAPQEGEASVDIFNRLMTGLEAQLGGMGVAFASSLLGLAGSLVVGLLELFAGHGQNRFYRELEEWLSTITRVSFTSEEAGGSPEAAAAPAGASFGTFADHMAEQMDLLQTMILQADEGRVLMEDRMTRLVDAIDHMTEKMPKGAGTGASELAGILGRIAEGQDRLTQVLEEGGGDGIDAESRMRLRSIDLQMLRILEEISAGRQETMADIRSDIASLSRAIRQSQSIRPRTVARDRDI